MKRFLVAIVPSILLAASMCGAQAASETPPAFRLPGDVAAPERYAVDLTLVPDRDTFSGSIEIAINFKRPTTVLWLNADQLKVHDATLATAGGSPIPAKVIPVPKDFVGFEFPQAVGPGPATLRVSFEGQVSRTDQAGIFQMKDGDDWYIYSQFENISARRAYPCFDEPGYKVPWRVTLHVKKDQLALSNSPILSETEGADGMKTVKFEETPPLPSYLVAYTVGHEELVDGGTTGARHTQVRIVVPRGRSEEAKYAAATTADIVNHLESYFGIPYPYAKLDEVAIPLAGYAMEHPGLVTYGSSIIIRKPDEATPGWQREWVSIASHELAHQWFGDLVTTAWWDDTWLNEGFASWMANKNVNAYHPEWRLGISELNSYQGAMDNDGLGSARRVRQPIESNDDIANAFDGITYNKGSALLNMFEQYMGPDRFREGVRRYLNKYAWTNATSADFLAELAGDDKAISAAFSSFLDQAGVPLVTARLECGSSPARLNLTQERFLPLGSSGTEALWKIPVCVRYPGAGGEGGRQCMLMDQSTATIPLPGAAGDCPGWVDSNAGAAGYYRVLYSPEVLGKLLQGDAAVLTLPEKISLIGDIAALTGNGKMPLGQALALAPALAHDPAREVVSKTMELTAGLGDHLVTPDLMPQYRHYLADLYGARAQALGWVAQAGEPDDSRLLRPRVEYVIANQAEDPAAIAEATRLAIAWMADHKALSPDMVSVTLDTAARHGHRDLFDRMRAAAKAEKNEEFESALLAAMGSFLDPDVVRAALPITLTDEFDPRQSLNLIFSASSQSNQTRDIAYDFIKTHWDAVVAKLPTDTGAYLPYVAAGYCDAGHRADAKSFFDGRSTKFTGGPRTLAQVLEGIDLCVAYKNAQQPSVAEFLQKYPQGGGAAGR